jgi:hypothetical protein
MKRGATLKPHRLNFFTLVDFGINRMSWLRIPLNSVNHIAVRYMNFYRPERSSSSERLPASDIQLRL